jgi:hypothetical protein
MRRVKALRALRIYAFSALSALSALSVFGCDDDVVAPTLGTLELTINGVPAGQAASVMVTGPGNFTRTVTATTTIGDLQPGTYTVAAANIDAADSRWSPTPARQSVTVASGPATAATVTYTLVTARLAVNITGLPNGVNANVTVTGPGGYSNVLTSSTAINLLTHGAYTITAADVTSGGTTYRPTPASQTINLAASTTQVTANVAYSAVALAPGSLTVTVTGLPTDLDAAVTVTGPGGYNQQVTSTQTLSSLPPGTYTITASSVPGNLTTHNPAPGTQTVTVTSGTTASGTVTYTSTALTLSVQQVTQVSRIRST